MPLSLQHVLILIIASHNERSNFVCKFLIRNEKVIEATEGVRHLSPNDPLYHTVPFTCPSICLSFISDSLSDNSNLSSNFQLDSSPLVGHLLKIAAPVVPVFVCHVVLGRHKLPLHMDAAEAQLCQLQGYCSKPLLGSASMKDKIGSGRSFVRKRKKDGVIPRASEARLSQLQ